MARMNAAALSRGRSRSPLQTGPHATLYSSVERDAPRDKLVDDRLLSAIRPNHTAKHTSAACQLHVGRVIYRAADQRIQRASQLGSMLLTARVDPADPLTGGQT